MKIFPIKVILASSLCLLSVSGYSENVLEDFDSLGGNDKLLEKVQALSPQKTVGIVQKRTTKRDNRHEIGADFLSAVGGDAYIQTNNLGLAYRYHITPRWSVDAHYAFSFNKLKEEGKSVIDKIDYVPEMDWPLHSTMAYLSYYPLYGKINFFNASVVQFDFFLKAGAGYKWMRNGTTPVYSGGGGFAYWMSQNLSARIEANFQSYNVKRFIGAERINSVLMGASVGYIL